MPRNGSGTYTLPAGNPVEPNTIIEADWANTTLEDLGNEITNSLSRTGEGGMLAPLRFYDGTSSVPGVAWLNETSSGWYRAGSGEFWTTVLATPVMQYTSAGVMVPSGVSMTVQGNQTVGGTLGVTGNFSVNTDKFTVAASSGNTAVAGTLGVTGLITASGGVSGNITTSSATITGGTINGTTIGASTPSSGAFTSLSASGAFSLTGDQVQVSEGGTGATTAAGARVNILPSYSTNALKFLRVNAGGTDVEWASEPNVGTVTSVNASGGSTGMSFSGGPITSSGTLTLAGTLAVASGGTGSTTASGARTALDVPSTSGSGATGTWGINVSGNAATVTNGVYTSGSYSDPSWITALAGSKVTGNISGNAGGLSSTLAVSSGGTGQTSYTNGQLLIGNSTGNTLSKATLTAGTGISITNGNGSITITSTSSGGTVTSVDVSGGTTGLTTSGGPITGSGTITLDGTLGVANGGTGATTLTGYVKGAGTSALTASSTIPTSDLSGTISLTSQVTGTLPVANGGTGVTTSTGSGNVVLSASPTLTGTLTAAAANFSGKVQIGGAVTGSNFGAKGASSGTAVSEFVAYDTTTTTMTTWARSDSAVAAALIYDGTGFMSLGTTTAHPLKLKYNNTDGITIGSGLVTLSTAINYGGVTLSNSVTGTGSMVLSASPTLTGTLTAAVANFSGAVTQTIGSTSRMSVVSTLNGAEAAFVFTGKDSGGAANSFKLGLGITADSEVNLYDVTNSASVFRYIRGGNFKVTPAVEIGNTYTGGAPSATGYVTITCNGVAYKFLVST